MSIFKDLVRTHGVPITEQITRGLVKKDKLKLEDVSIKQLYEELCGEDLSLHRKAKGYVETKEQDLEEAYVTHTAFSNITGELISKEIIAAYKNVNYIGDKLTKVYKTNKKEERIAGFIGSEGPETVQEGDAYPESGISDKYIKLGDAEKKGRIISLTEETVFYDQTGRLVERAQGIGEKAGLEKEKKILKAILGIDTAYYPSGTGTALYGAAPYIVASNALVDWTDIEKAELDGFYAMQDDSPDTDYIVSVPQAILVPVALNRTAKRILNATEVVHGDYDSAASVKVKGANPVYKAYKIYTSVLIHILQIAAGVDAAVAKSNWWFGDFQKQFRWKQVWPLQVFSAPQKNIMQFERDIVSRYKVRYFGNPFVMDNKYVVKNKTAS